jgi:transmembrane sensor
MTQEEILELIKKYDQGNCTPEEAALLDTWYVNQNEILQQELPEAKISKDLSEISKNLSRMQRKVVLWPRLAAAASIIIVLSAAGYFWLKAMRTQTIANLVQNTIVPGGNKAILHLGNGKKIILTDAKNGYLAKGDQTAITKTSSGEIVYTKSDSSPSGSVTYDTLTTPRGGIWHLTLTDGTKVWLNAVTTIIYPENFSGKTRSVKLISGEAYFEVLHNATKPFSVIVKDHTIEDIGTHFNVDAYEDEQAIKTTLLEGSIAIKLDGSKKRTVIAPGQEANVKNSNLKVKPADMAAAVAWKNGLFHFDHTNVRTLMLQISRWYDVQIQYRGNITNHEFAGEIQRNTSLENVLKILGQGGVNFKVQGRKIILEE